MMSMRLLGGALGVIASALVVAGGVTTPVAHGLEIPGGGLLSSGWPVGVSAGVHRLADREVVEQSADGWVLHAAKLSEEVFVSPALDGGLTTGEAFGSLDGRVWVDGQGNPGLTSGVFEAGYQVGCGVDIASGMDVELAGVVGGVARGLAGVSGGPHVDVELPNITGVGVGGDLTGKTEVGADGKVEVAPRVSSHIDPGGITNVALASYPLSLDYRRAAGGFRGAHLIVTGCVGPVSIRSYVQLSATSDTSVDSITVYGDPVRIR